MTKESDIADMKAELKLIKGMLIGNGTKGLLRKMDEAATNIIKLQSNTSVKMWIYRSVIGALIAISTFLATRAYYIKFGG